MRSYWKSHDCFVPPTPLQSRCDALAAAIDTACSFDPVPVRVPQFCLPSGMEPRRGLPIAESMLIHSNLSSLSKPKELDKVSSFFDHLVLLLPAIRSKNLPPIFLQAAAISRLDSGFALWVKSQWRVKIPWGLPRPTGPQDPYPLPDST
jgi:hypothetical protein